MGDIEHDMELYDIQDQADTVGWLTPIEYAKLRGKSSQLIYYYIRNKVIETEYCRCGRRVLHVGTADKALEAKALARGKQLDARSDDERDEGQGTDLQELPQEDPLA